MHSSITNEKSPVNSSCEKLEHPIGVKTKAGREHVAPYVWVWLCQGLKPCINGTLSARLKSCPDTNHYHPRVCSKSFSSIADTASPFIAPGTCSLTSARTFGSL